MLIFYLFYCFRAQAEGIMTLRVRVSHAVSACVFTSVLSYVGHGENDSCTGH